MPEPRMRLISPAFDNDEVIPSKHTCEGENYSPGLRWEFPPADTRSFALIMEDADASRADAARDAPRQRGGGVIEESGPRFVHWVLYDIPAGVEEFPENAAGAGVAGRNDFQTTAYKGPCPPAGHDHHRYYFKLYALDVDSLDLDAGGSAEEVVEAMEGHILAQAELVGRFGRQTAT